MYSTTKSLSLLALCLLSTLTAGCAGYGHGNDIGIVSQEPPVPPARMSQKPSTMFPPLPLPQAMIVTPAPAAMLVVYAADSFFDFDQATVKQESKYGLEQFVVDIYGAEFDVITVTGHTDRIGPHQYNLDLSLRRAEAVKTYLVESAGIPADKIRVRGVDGADPGTTPDECPGQQVTENLITCLQPDRRVEVEVFGTRSP